MNKNLLWRLAVIVVVLGFCLLSLFPLKERVRLGLDLKGGIHLVLEVKTQDAIKADAADALETVKTRFSRENITVLESDFPEINTFVVAVPAERLDEAFGLARDYLPGWTVERIEPNSISVVMQAAYQRERENLAVRQALETIRNRVDELGLTEPTIQRQGMGDNRILVQLPGLDDPMRVKNIIKSTALLELRLVEKGPAPDRQAILDSYGGTLPPHVELFPGRIKDDEGQIMGRNMYALSDQVAITGRDLRSARRDVDSHGLPAVSFSLNPTGAKKFEKVTSAHVGDSLAIILDGVVQSAPRINSAIPSGEGIIEGNFNVQRAEDLALVLRSGALPASITYLEERTVGPSLGQDSIRRGVRAALLGLVLVMIFMVFYYRISGINAVVALTFNMIIIFGVMAYFKATLTLPGVAGIILTIGMAVDANVLVFERIREELGLGKNVRAAIAAGFSRAFGTIVDANVTTLIAALFLFQFGTGPIRGFAVTLMIGIIGSMFTAVFVSRFIYDSALARKPRVTSLSI